MIITLTTDFGNDTYAGIMKGVILSINPKAAIVDISHKIQPQNINQAVFILKTAIPYFPKESIHCVIVDPGVGSNRSILLVETDASYFLAPDNGVLHYIFQEHEIKSVHQVNNSKFFLDKISTTFHGRDIFAPVAAHLSLGIATSEFGSPISEYDRGQMNAPIIETEKTMGEILFFDHFGNAITNIPDSLISEKAFVLCKGIKIPFHTTYSNAADKTPLALIGSHNHLEIAIRNGNAREQLALEKGQTITILNKSQDNLSE